MKSLFVIAALAVSALTLAQNPQSLMTLSVTVRDAAGSVIPGVTVRATGPGGVVAGITNEKGSVDLRVPPGSNQVTASLSGFDPQLRILTVKDGVQTLEITMQIAQRNPFEREPIVDIQADNISSQGNLILYRGNVRMKTTNVEVRAEEMDLNRVTRNASARGNVTIQLLPAGARMIPVGSN